LRWIQAAENIFVCIILYPKLKVIVSLELQMNNVRVLKLIIV